MASVSEKSAQETAPGPTFGAILRETISEMENASVGELAFEDVVQRLSLAAHHALSAQPGGPLPRVGGYAYMKSTVTPPEKTQSQLDVRY